MASLKKFNNHQNKALDNLPKLAQSILNNWPSRWEKSDTTTSYAIGLSGGIDSVVLLHIFKLLQQEFAFNLQAIHVNHNISPNATKWQRFCEELCYNLNIPLTIFQHYVTKNGGESLENNARKFRYQSFTEFYEKYNHNHILLQENNAQNNTHSNHRSTQTNKKLIILLAHHQNDQIETVLSQILRGSDLHNIAAMQPISQKGVHLQLFWRPLLNTTKQDILAYATQYNLQYIEDESNADTTYLRNFLRHDILPRIQKWDPQVNNKILVFNHYIKNATILSDELAQIDLVNTKIAQPNDKGTHNNDVNSGLTSYKLDATKFKLLSEPRQHNLISHFILLHQKPLPSYKQIHEFCRQVTNSAWDSAPELRLANTYSIKKFKNNIFINPPNF